MEPTKAGSGADPQASASTPPLIVTEDHAGPETAGETSPIDRRSMETSINLNDDLANGSEISEGSATSHPSSHMPRRAGSGASYRHSIDADSSFGSAFFQSFNNIDEITDSDSGYSPLGPNSIYELTIASDLARERRRAGKVSVTLNGGLSTVYNLKTPTTKDIPQIQLSKLHSRVASDEIVSKLVAGSEADYKSFNEGYNALTADTLSRLAESGPVRSGADSSVGEPESEIPAVFSDPNFRLDDPRIFKQVIGDCNILPDLDDFESTSGTRNLANNNSLQDQLSHYLDTVEVNLISEISKSSNSFFNTVEDIQTVSRQSQETVEFFNDVVARLDGLENDSIQAGLSIVRKINQRNNVEHLESSILQLSYITKLFDVAKRSFDAGSHAKCLNVIVVVEGLIRGHDVSSEETIALPGFKYPLLDLSTLPALIHIQNDLQNLKNQCSRGYITDFNDLLINDLRSHYQSVPLQDTLDRIYFNVDRHRRIDSSKLNRNYQDLSSDTLQKLRDYVENLVKAGQLAGSFNAYQDRIIVEIKDIIKTNLPKSGAASADMSNAPSRSSSVPPEQTPSESYSNSTSNSLSASIKNLTAAEFEAMLAKIYCALSECLRRLTKHQKILLDLALSSISPGVDIDIMAFDLTLAINKAIELTQIRISKVINVRSEQIADMPVNQYLRFYSLSSAYLQECEMINPGYVAGGAGSSLNDWIRNHVGYFVHRFHSGSLRALVANSDKETWKEVTDGALLSKAQAELDEIVGYGEFIESNGIKGTNGDGWSKVLVLYDFFQQQPPVEPAVSDATKLKIHDEAFMIPKLIVSSISQIRDYLIVAHMFPHKAALVENNLMNYFKLMNSKASQSVLNAGATRTAGLKHITTKHIALCIQFVEFNIGLLPFVKSSFSKVRPGSPLPQQNGNEDLSFDQLTSNYKDHENELFAKLVSIMYDRTLSHCQAILKLDLSVPLKSPQQCHTYMEVLVKDTTTVTKVLAKYLPEIKQSLILSQIFDNYKKLFVECFCTQLPQFKDLNEKHSLMKDIDYFRVKLFELPGYGNSGQVIWENVNALPTIEDRKMDEVMKNNIEQEKAHSQKASLEVQRKSEEQPKETPKTEPPKEPKETKTEPANEEVLFEIKPDTAEKPEASSTETKPVKDSQVDESKEQKDVDIKADVGEITIPQDGKPAGEDQAPADEQEQSDEVSPAEEQVKSVVQNLEGSYMKTDSLDLDRAIEDPIEDTEPEPEQHPSDEPKSESVESKSEPDELKSEPVEPKSEQPETASESVEPASESVELAKAEPVETAKSEPAETEATETATEPASAPVVISSDAEVLDDTEPKPEERTEEPQAKEPTEEPAPTPKPDAGGPKPEEPETAEKLAPPQSANTASSPKKKKKKSKSKKKK